MDMTGLEARKGILYLDNLSTTEVLPIVRESMTPFLEVGFGNPSSVHRPGRTASDALKKARENVAELLDADPSEIYFSPSGTQGNNTIILGRARVCEAQGAGKHAVTSTVEHSSVADVFDFLERSKGWSVTRLAPAPGKWHIAVPDLLHAITDDTSIVSISAVDPRSGAIQDFSSLAASLSGRRIFVHIDAVLCPGRCNLGGLPKEVSALTLSAHKFGGPKGVGAIFVRRGNSLMPAVFGGGQEMGYFPGTERVADIVGMGAAVAVALDHVRSQSTLFQSIQESVFNVTNEPSENWSWFGPPPGNNRLPGHVSLHRPHQVFAPHGVDQALAALFQQGVLVGKRGDVLVAQFDSTHDVTDASRLLKLLNSELP